MTAVESRVEQQRPTRSHSVPRLRRLGGAVAMVAAPWGFVVTNALYTWATRAGGSDATGAEALALAARQPDLLRVLLLSGLVGCLLLVPAVVTTMALAPRSWLVSLGGSLMVAGYTCYFGVLLSNFTIIAMAEHGGPLGDFAAVIDAGQSDGSAGWVFLLFVVGNLLGTLLLALGLLRSRAVPRWAAVLVLSWPPLHVTGLVVGNELFEVVGAVLQALGFAGLAGQVWRSAAVEAAAPQRKGPAASR